jgi:hypothetical protein
MARSFNSHPISISSPAKPPAMDGASIEEEGEARKDRRPTLDHSLSDAIDYGAQRMGQRRHQ